MPRALRLALRSRGSHRFARSRRRSGGLLCLVVHSARTYLVPRVPDTLSRFNLRPMPRARRLALRLLSEGLRPSDSLTRSLASTFAVMPRALRLALRSRGSVAALPRADRRFAPARLREGVGVSRRSLGEGGTPLHALSLQPSPDAACAQVGAAFAWLASLRSLASSFG